MQMIATPSLTAFAAADDAAAISASDLKPVESVSSAPVEEAESVETPAAEEPKAEEPKVEEPKAEEVVVPELKAPPAEAEKADAVSYVDENGNTATVSDYNVVDESTTSMSGSEKDGWYVVNANVTVSKSIVVTGNVKLILCDGYTLTANYGIGVSTGNSLTVYVQSEGTGALTAKAYKKNSNTYAAIGGYGKSKGATRRAGTITINGGNIKATSSTSYNCAAIGGLQSDAADKITINGGIVSASVEGYSQSLYAAIGYGYGGDNSKAGEVFINGGQVTATGPSGKGVGIGAKDGITLSHSHYTDFINASGYNPAPTLSKDFMIKDTSTQATSSNAGGKTIVPRYKVVFYDTDGTTVQTTVYVAGGKKVTELPAYTPAEGFVFKGWKDKTTGEAFTTDEIIKGDREIVADCEKDAFTVTFYNWDETVISTVDVINGQRPQFPDMSECQPKEGYNFSEAWFDKATGEEFGEEEVITSDRELIAGLKAKSYRIDYDLGEGGTAENPVNYTIETETFTLNNPTWEGYKFIGWTGAGYDEPTMEITIAKGTTGDMKFTAHWETVKCTITFDIDSGCEIKVLAIDPETEGDDQSTQSGRYIEDGEKVDYGTVLEVLVTVKPGRWISDGSNYSGDIKVTEDTTICIVTAPYVYSLEVIHEHGAEPTFSCADPNNLHYGDEVTVTPGEAEEGYEFIGFYRTNGVKLYYDEANPDYTFTVTGDTTIEARYQKVGNTVTFISSGQIVKSETYETFTENDFPADPAAPTGYKFSGWSKTAEQINEALQTGSVTVEAQFEAVQESFTVSIYNGEAEEPETVECEQSKIITRIAAKVNGKNFAYWTLDDDIISYNTTVSYIATQDGVLRAVYSTEAVEAIGTATLKTAKYNVEARKLVINVYLALPNDNCKIVKAGLIAASAEGDFDPENQQLTDELSGTGVYKKSLASAVGKSVPVDYTWTKTNVAPGDKWYVCARLEYTDENNNPQVIYGDMFTFIAGNDYDSSEKGTATIRSISYNEDTKVATFKAYLTVPENAVIVKAGLVAASSTSEKFNSETDVLTSSNADYAKSLASAVGKSAPVDYTWNKTNVEVDWYARAWLVYDLEGTRHTVYGDLELLKVGK